MPTNIMAAGSGPVTPENDDIEALIDLDAERKFFTTLAGVRGFAQQAGVAV